MPTIDGSTVSKINGVTPASIDGIAFATAPSAVTIGTLLTSAGNEQITVPWTGGIGATNFNVYYKTGSDPDGTFSGSNSASEGVFTGVTSPYRIANGLTAGTTYNIKVKAINSASTALSAAAAAAAAALPNYFGLTTEGFTLSTIPDYASTIALSHGDTHDGTLAGITYGSVYFTTGSSAGYDPGDDNPYVDPVIGGVRVVKSGLSLTSGKVVSAWFKITGSGTSYCLLEVRGGTNTVNHVILSTSYTVGTWQQLYVTLNGTATTIDISAYCYADEDVTLTGYFDDVTIDGAPA